MSTNALNLDAYLKRVHDAGPLTPSVETLRRLHRAQAVTIPFENLDIFLGREIQIDPDHIITKLVEEKRGGYCFELNGLFSLVLEQLGFSFTRLAGRPFQEEKVLQKSHQLLLVEVDGERWLADVGFGGNGLVEPIPLVLNTEFPQYLDTFRLQTDSKLGLVLQHKLADHWRNLYAFSLEEYYPADYHMMNYYVSHAPSSRFTQQYFCTMPTAEARIILLDNEVKIRRPAQAQTIKRQIESEVQLRETLQHFFGIVLPSTDKLLLPPSLPGGDVSSLQK